MDVAELIKQARSSAGITQRELAERMGTTQSAVAQLESPRSNPTVSTLERAFLACGRRLALEAPRQVSSIDESLVASLLRVPVAERLPRFERAYAEVRQLALAGRQARGELV